MGQKYTNLWYTYIQEPASWLVIHYLQPEHFQRQIEPVKGRQRILPTLRLLLPIFLCTWLSSLLVRTIIYHINLHLYRSVAPTSVTNEFLLSAWHTSKSCAEALLIVIIGGIFVNLAFGISAGLAVGFIAGLMTNLQTTSLLYGTTLVLFVGPVTGCTMGLALGLPASHSRLAGNNILHILSGIGLGLLSGTVNGSIFGLIAGVISGSPGIALSGSYATFAGAIAGGLATFFFFLFLKNLLRNHPPYTRVFLDNGQTVGVVFGAIIGMSIGTGGFILGATGQVAQMLTAPWKLALWLSLTTVTSFLFVYIIGYYRLPLYPISACSTWLAYRAARRQPKALFHHLRHSALYWDERVFLSLPYLRHLLLNAAFHDQEEARHVIEFIIVERPEQISEVRDACQEITVRELEQHDNLRSISTFARWFENLFPQGTRLIDAHWNTPFAHFCHVSRACTQYNSPLSWQARKKILIEMENSLRGVHPTIAFESSQLNHRLQCVVERWLTIIKNEQEKYREVPEDIGNLPNPYISGQAIQSDDPTFVGRRDLALHLERALSREQYRPTFFLTGERRMGKSSTLNQLPNLLSRRYLPIVLDLQSRGKTSSASTFLWSIADAVVVKLESKGIALRRLDIAQLIEASRENEAAVYGHFESWLADLERTLIRIDHVVVVAFDEFEKLEESTQAHYLDLRLLLDWFRSTIQHSKRLVFLFSGVKPLGAMGPMWAGYFVNVETLRVSFLHPDEAYRLITRPTPQFPSEQIYSEEVVERIMEVTAHHPFLIQALCSKLIDNLNAFQRDWAELRDVDAAVEDVLDSWWTTYFQDLWQRTDDKQRLCLQVLLSQKERGNDLQSIADQTQLAPNVVRRTLEELRQRNLICAQEGKYSTASYMIERWIERNC